MKRQVFLLYWKECVDLLPDVGEVLKDAGEVLK